MTDALSGLFLDDGQVGRARGSQTFVRGFLSAWNTTTGENTVTVDVVTYTNCPFLTPNDHAAGNPVLLAVPPGGGLPIIIGRFRIPPI